MDNLRLQTRAQKQPYTIHLAETVYDYAKLNMMPTGQIRQVKKKHLFRQWLL